MSLLKILYSNINSYCRRKHIINNYIEKHDINCTLFVEAKTTLNSNTQYRNWDKISFSGNQIHNKTRGGSLVQAHPTLKMGKENPPRINNLLNETIHFTVPFLGEKLHIFLVYIHPHSRIEETIFTKASLYKYSIIIGDVNLNRQKKKQLSNFLNNTNFEQHQTPPTFLMPNNPDSTPDILLYTKNIKQNFSKVDIIPDIGSDHLAIYVEFDLQTVPLLYQPEIKYNFTKCDIEKVNTLMLRHISINETINTDSITSFNQKLSQAILDNTPTYDTKYYTHELPPFIISLIKKKRKLYREYKLNDNPTLKKEINLLNKNIQNLIQEFNLHKWIGTCEKINEKKGKNYWYEIRKLTKYKNNTHDIKTAITENNIKYETEEEKLNIFATHFENSYKEDHNNRYDQQHYEYVNEWVDNFVKERIAITEQNIEEDEYFEIIHQGKNTTPGHDNITKDILKKLKHDIHLYIIKIYEYCLTNHHFPIEWKVGTIVTIPKKQTDLTKVCNYRPITLLSNLGKNFEKIIVKRILAEIGEKIPKYQFGFKQKNSTTHPLIILTNNVQATKLKGRKTAAVFLDTNKAFDSVWHNGLIYKLIKLGCSEYIVRLICQILKNRVLKVKIGGKYSNEFSAAQGLPQGSPLSPVLYNVYCSDIFNNDPEYFNQDNYVLQYADDTALISHSTSIHKAIKQLQNLTDNTIRWLSKWRLKLNPNKSHLIIFNHTPSNTSPSVTMYNQIIKPEVSTKYLGIIIDNKLNYNLHTAEAKKNIVTRSSHFRSLTYKNKGINRKTACQIYKLICRPLIEYGYILFTNVRNPAIKKLQVAETSSLRKLTKIRHPDNPLHNPPNELLYELTEILPINLRIQELAKRFVQRESNTDILERFCIKREEPHISTFKYPQNTLWEKLSSLAEN